MKLIEKTARYEIWFFPAENEYAVYGYFRSGDAKICPSIGMARSFAAGI